MLYKSGHQSAFILWIASMFQNNPLLSQLKQQIRDSKQQVEGIVKGSDKAFGFLECDKKVTLFPLLQ